MRLPWNKPKTTQLSLLDGELVDVEAVHAHTRRASSPTQLTPARFAKPEAAATGAPLLVAASRLIEDPNNPRTEFPETELDELAADIRERGILQPLVVHPADAEGRYRLHFGAKRLRAAIRVGLSELPVVIRDAPADPYAQAAENQKRHGLSPLDMARLVRARVDAGDSNATIAKRLVMDLTTVAHLLALLDLPPVLDEAMKAGRCTSPRTLYELSKLYESQPERVNALVAGAREITRVAVAATRKAPTSPAVGSASNQPSPSAIAQAESICERLEHALDQVQQTRQGHNDEAIAALRHRVAHLTSRLA